VRSSRSNAYWEAAESQMGIVVCVFSSVPAMAMTYEQKKQV